MANYWDLPPNTCPTIDAAKAAADSVDESVSSAISELKLLELELEEEDGDRIESALWCLDQVADEIESAKGLLEDIRTANSALREAAEGAGEEAAELEAERDELKSERDQLRDELDDALSEMVEAAS
jgi:chromosome segregation ATPase